MIGLICILTLMGCNPEREIISFTNPSGEEVILFDVTDHNPCFKIIGEANLSNENDSIASIYFIAKMACGSQFGSVGKCGYVCDPNITIIESEYGNFTIDLKIPDQ